LMLRSIRGRLSRVEESLPVPMTAERFYARGQLHAKRTDGSVGDAIATVAKDLGDSEVVSITTQFEQIAFGSDTAARDAAKRETLGAAGHPVWNLLARHREKRDGDKVHQPWSKRVSRLRIPVWNFHRVREVRN
jgi:hypothetical protein